jgi:hypothetical protein
MDFAWFFGQFPMPQEVASYFALKKRVANWWIPSTIPTGARQPPIFCQLLCRAISRETLCRAKRAGVDILLSVESDEFVDNIRFVGNTCAQLNRVKEYFFEVTRDLGATVNELPSEVSPREEYTFLGIEFSHGEKCVSLSEKTRDKLLQMQHGQAPF